MAAADRWFKRKQRGVEFIVVAESESRVVPLSGSPKTAHARSLQAAIEQSRFEQVAILDPVYRFEAMHWNLVDPLDKPAAFRSWSFALNRAPGSRRLLAKLLVGVTRLLLRVRKTRLACGLITFTKAQLSHIDLSRLDPDSPDASTELLAIAKSRGLPIEEIRSGVRQSETHWTKKNSCDPNLPRSSSLKRSITRAIQFWFSELAFPAPQNLRVAARAKTVSGFGRSVLSALVLLMAAVLLFTNLGYPLFEPDETRSAQLAINVLESGDWLSLSLSGEPYYDKPPLLTWLTAICYSLLGSSEWTTRLPSQLASFLTVGFMLYAGRKLFGFRRSIYGCVLLLLAWGFSGQSRYVTTDSLLTFFTTVSTLSIANSVMPRSQERQLRTGWLLLAGIAMGLGLLTKGPICAMLVLPPLLLWMMLCRDLSSKDLRSILRIVLLPAGIVATPWYLLNSIRHPEFLWQFAWKHHVLRFSDAFIHVEPFWYYLPVGYLMMFPASILLPRAIHVMTSDKRKHRDERNTLHGLLLLFCIWTVGLFSFSNCKLPTYILPAFPMFALLIAAVLDMDLQRAIGQRTRIDRLANRVSIGICCLSVVALAIGCRFAGQSMTMVCLAGLALLTSVALAFTLLVKRSTSRQASWLGTAAVAFAFVFLCGNFVVPAISSQRSILSGLSVDQRDASLPVVYFGRDSFASSLYLPGRKVSYIDEESLAEAEDWLKRHPKAICVASDENAQRIAKALGRSGAVEKMSIRHVFRISVRPSRVADSKGAAEVRK